MIAVYDYRNVDLFEWSYRRFKSNILKNDVNQLVFGI